MYAILATSTPTTVDTIIAQISTVVTMMTDLLTSLISNPFFAFLFACGFIRIGFSLIKKAKKTAR